jgi:hypothetical protein
VKLKRHWGKLRSSVKVISMFIGGSVVNSLPPPSLNLVVKKEVNTTEGFLNITSVEAGEALVNASSVYRDRWGMYSIHPEILQPPCVHDLVNQDTNLMPCSPVNRWDHFHPRNCLLEDREKEWVDDSAPGLATSRIWWQVNPPFSIL